MVLVAALLLVAPGAARGESTSPPPPAAVLKNAEETVARADLTRKGAVYIGLFDGRSFACPSPAPRARALMLELAGEVAGAEAARTPARRPCAEGEWQPDPRLEVPASADAWRGEEILSEPGCGTGSEPKDAAKGRAARRLAGLLASEARACLAAATDPLEMIAARARAEQQEADGRRKLAEGRPRAARKEFEPCRAEAVHGRLRAACQRGLEEAERRLRGGETDAPAPSHDVMVAFKAGSAEPTPEGRARMASLGDLLRYYPLDSVVLTAFVRARSPEADALAERRLEAARGALTDAGAKVERIRGVIEVSAGSSDAVRIATAEGD